MDPEPSYIKAVLAYLGEESNEEEVYAPTVSATELEEELGFNPSNTLLYLEEREVIATGSTREETYATLENNKSKAREFAREVEEDYDGSFRDYAEEAGEILFIDYPSSFDVPEPDSMGPHVPKDTVDNMLGALSD